MQCVWRKELPLNHHFDLAFISVQNAEFFANFDADITNFLAFNVNPADQSVSTCNHMVCGVHCSSILHTTHKHLVCSIKQTARRSFLSIVKRWVVVFKLISEPAFLGHLNLQLSVSPTSGIHHQQTVHPSLTFQKNKLP